MQAEALVADLASKRHCICSAMTGACSGCRAGYPYTASSFPCTSRRPGWSSGAGPWPTSPGRRIFACGPTPLHYYDLVRAWPGNGISSFPRQSIMVIKEKFPSQSGGSGSLRAGVFFVPRFRFDSAISLRSRCSVGSSDGLNEVIVGRLVAFDLQPRG
jgi:hypothetical protein